MFLRRLCTIFVMLLVPLLLVAAGRLVLAQAVETHTAGAAPAAEISAEPLALTEMLGVEQQAIPLVPATGQDLDYEIEPNNFYTEATSLNGDTAVVLGYIYPQADTDYYSFTAGAGDRLYAALMTGGSSNGDSDSVLTVLDSDGVTVLEQDLDDGFFGDLSSTVAGTELPAAGTYYLEVRHNNPNTHLRPYHLHFHLKSGSPTAEVEPNDSSFGGQPIGPNSWISGSLSSVNDPDWYILQLNPGDTVFLSLDLDPTRDNTQWDGRLTMIGLTGSTVAMVNDESLGTPSNPLSEALFMTVREWNYYIRVDAAGATYGDYHLSVIVHPAAPQNCTTHWIYDYQSIPTGDPSMISSGLIVPGNPVIGDLNVRINVSHQEIGHLDVALYSPAGNTNLLFNDLDVTPSGMQMALDDEAAVPIGSVDAMFSMAFQPVYNTSLDWFDGERAGGEWLLLIWDDTAGVGGTLHGWGLEICEPAEPPPACPAGMVLDAIYSSNFEANDGGFTHSGTADEWERGLPTAAPITSCHSGLNCWKTDLDGTYEAGSDQDLFSPAVDLASYSDGVWVQWAQKYQMGDASHDHAFVDVQEAGGANPRRLWEWLGAGMSTVVGSAPEVTLKESAGWAEHTADISDYQGSQIELRFHLDSAASGSYSGLAVDDVTVLACVPAGDAPDIAVAPTSLSVAQLPDEQTQQTLDINNLGPGDLNWSLVAEENPAGPSLGNRPAITASLTATAPNLNGLIEPAEWASAYTVEMGRLGAPVYLHLMHDGEFLYMAIDDHADSELDFFDTFGLYFDDEGGTPPTLYDNGWFNEGCGLANTGEGDYWIGYYPPRFPSRFVEDQYRQWHSGSSFCETQYGNTNVQYDYGASSGHMQYELAIPLDGSAALTAGIGQWVGVHIYSADSGSTVTGDWPEGAVFEDPATFGSLYLSPSHCVPGNLPWVSALPSSGSTPSGSSSPVTVTFDSNGLAPGYYSGNLCIESNDPDESEVMVPVTLDVVGIPADIAVSPTSLTTTLYTGEQVTQSVEISNLGEANLDWTVAEADMACDSPADVTWLAANPTAGTTPGNSTTAIEVTFDATDLLSGIYTALLCLSSNDADEPLVAVPVTLTVQAWPADMAVTPTSLASTQLPDEQVVQILAISNLGEADLHWVVAEANEACDNPADMPWLAANPTAGSTPGGSTSTVDVTFDSTDLAAGTYTAVLCLDSNDADEPLLMVPATLTVQALPVPAISLAVTVGTDPAGCATTAAIEVPAGTTVTYCYAVANSGAITVTTHDLVDSELGRLLDGYVYQLAPGAGFYITTTAIMNTNTTNTAIWTAYAASGQSMAEDSATVTVYEDGVKTHRTFLPLMNNGAGANEAVGHRLWPVGFLALGFPLLLYSRRPRRRPVD